VNTIKGIERVKGAEKQLGLTLFIKDTGLNAGQLITPEHEAWLKNSEAYWYQKLWGESA
jgi:hypothetical protein